MSTSRHKETALKCVSEGRGFRFVVVMHMLPPSMSPAVRRMGWTNSYIEVVVREKDCATGISVDQAGIWIAKLDGRFFGEKIPWYAIPTLLAEEGSSAPVEVADQNKVLELLPCAKATSYQRTLDGEPTVVEVALARNGTNYYVLTASGDDSEDGVGYGPFDWPNARAFYTTYITLGGGEYRSRVEILPGHRHDAATGWITETVQ